jgi:hypothetical protein
MAECEKEKPPTRLYVSSLAGKNQFCTQLGPWPPLPIQPHVIIYILRMETEAAATYIEDVSNPSIAMSECNNFKLQIQQA